jgi:hypothetical protein
MNVAGVHYQKNHAALVPVIEPVTKSHDDAGLNIKRDTAAIQARQKRDKGAKIRP